MVNSKLEGYLNTFEKAVSRFGEALQHKDNVLLLDASMQRFEFCYELSWKTLKRFLEVQGISNTKTPREVFSEAFRLGWLTETDDFWMNLIKDRNLSSHLYSEEDARLIFNKFPEYLEAFKNIVNKLKSM